MKPTVSRLLACIALLLAPVALAAPAAADPDPARSRDQSWIGVWRNTNNTVHINATACGEEMCGTVVWANEQTKAAVAAKGRNIIGMQLFRNFRQTAPKEWRGTVYIPDMGASLSGKITLTDRNNLAASGCVFLGMGCQTRHWSRIS